MRWETAPVIPKHESASLLTSRMTVLPVTPELVLAHEVYLMSPTRVEIRQRTRQIMATSTSKPGAVKEDIVNFPNFKPRGHHEIENVVS